MWINPPLKIVPNKCTISCLIKTPVSSYLKRRHNADLSCCSWVPNSCILSCFGCDGGRNRGCGLSVCEKEQLHVCHTQSTMIGSDYKLTLASITVILHVCHDMSHFSSNQSPPKFFSCLYIWYGSEMLEMLFQVDARDLCQSEPEPRATDRKSDYIWEMHSCFWSPTDKNMR